RRAVPAAARGRVMPNNTVNADKSVTPHVIIQSADGATLGALTAYTKIAAANTNAASVKAAAGRLHQVQVTNVAAYAVYLKLYDKASSPTVGTDTEVLTFGVPAGGSINIPFVGGLPFAAGIAIAITKLA